MPQCAYTQRKSDSGKPWVLQQLFIGIMFIVTTISVTNQIGQTPVIKPTARLAGSRCQYISIYLTFVVGNIILL